MKQTRSDLSDSITAICAVKSVDSDKQSAEKAVKVARGQLYPLLSFQRQFQLQTIQALPTKSSFSTPPMYLLLIMLSANGVKNPVFIRKTIIASQKIPYNDQLNNNRYNDFSLNLRIPIFNSLYQRNQVEHRKDQCKECRSCCSNDQHTIAAID